LIAPLAYAIISYSRDRWTTALPAFNPATAARRQGTLGPVLRLAPEEELDAGADANGSTDAEVHFAPLDLDQVRTPQRGIADTTTDNSQRGVRSPSTGLSHSLSHDEASLTLAGLPVSSFPGTNDAEYSSAVVRALTEDAVEVRAFRKITKYARQISASIPSAGAAGLSGIWHPRQVLQRSHLYLDPDELAAVTKSKQGAQPAQGTRTSTTQLVPAADTGPDAKTSEEDLACGMMLSLPSDAWLGIIYDEGFPTINGAFFWEPLPGEPPSYYKLFRTYLDQYKNPRGQKARPSLKAKVRVPTRGGRSLFLLQESIPDDLMGKFPLAKLEAISYLYYWGERSAAYDRYIDTEINYRLAHIAGDMDSRHLNAAQAFFEQAVSLLTERVHDLDAKTLLDLLKYSVGLERTSLGRTESNSPHRNGPSVVVQTLNQVNGQGQGGTSTGASGSSAQQALPSARGGAAGYAGSNGRSPGGVVAVTRDRGAANQANAQLQGPAGDQPMDIMSALRDPNTAALLQKLALQLQGADTERGSNARGQS
jgi:hypothetical protein